MGVNEERANRMEGRKGRGANKFTRCQSIKKGLCPFLSFLSQLLFFLSSFPPAVRSTRRVRYWKVKNDRLFLSTSRVALWGRERGEIYKPIPLSTRLPYWPAGQPADPKGGILAIAVGAIAAIVSIDKICRDLHPAHTPPAPDGTGKVCDFL